MGFPLAYGLIAGGGLLALASSNSDEDDTATAAATAGAGGVSKSLTTARLSSAPLGAKAPMLVKPLAPPLGGAAGAANIAAKLATRARTAAASSSVKTWPTATIAFGSDARGPAAGGALSPIEQRTHELAENLKAEVIKKIDSLEGAARCAAIEAANKEFGLELACDTPSEDVLKAIGASAGSTAGVAVCTSLGYTAAIAPLCGAAGAWLGAIVAQYGWPWAKDMYGDAKEWLSGALDDVGGAIEDGANYVWDNTLGALF